ncbi:MAG: hypothetical protein J0M13_17350, partial [Candidatus Accumulibacter sp.]|nr:hypothetical protein [Candidatus Accumulibacter necessarius]
AHSRENEEKTVQKAAKSRKSGLFIPHCEIWRFSKPQVRQAASQETQDFVESVRYPEFDRW